jgi:hypothetical protein
MWTRCASFLLGWDGIWFVAVVLYSASVFSSGCRIFPASLWTSVSWTSSRMKSKCLPSSWYSFSFLITAARAAPLTSLFSVIRRLNSIGSSCAARSGGKSLNSSLVVSFNFSSVCLKVSSFCVRKFSNWVLI